MVSGFSGFWVARSTRAWIETIYSDWFSFLIQVARSTRAWIETRLVQGLTARRSSHALRVRGLKQKIYEEIKK